MWIAEKVEHVMDQIPNDEHFDDHKIKKLVTDKKITPRWKQMDDILSWMNVNIYQPANSMLHI